MIRWQPIDALATWAADIDEPAAGGVPPLLGYQALWRGLAAALKVAPGRARVAEVGRSVDDEPLWAACLEPAEPTRATVFVVAGLHALEHVGTVVAARLLTRAAADPEKWNGVRLIVMPLVNADGFRDVCADLGAGRRRFRRKNRRGVDLNRNFSAHFARGRGLRAWIARRFFDGGPRALSEPETAAVDRVLAATSPAIAISLHAFGRWIYLPWAGTRDPCPRAAELEGVATQMVAAMSRPYRVTVLGRRSRLFLARGAEIDHFLASGALSFLFEIGGGPRLRSPGGWLQPYRWYTPPPDVAEDEIEDVIAAIETLGGGWSG